MTAFHDSVLALEPSIFVAYDDPADTASLAHCLVTGGTMAPGTASRVAAVGSVGFSYELQCDDPGEYWTADATLEAGVIAALLGAESFTIGAFWRTTVGNSGTAAVILSLSNDGFRLYRQSAIMIGTYYDAGSVSRSQNATGATGAEAGGGWQVSGMQLDTVENELIMLRGITRVYNSSQADGSTIRVSSSTQFYHGATHSAASPWIGSLGPFAIWNRVLTPTEWRTFHNAGYGIEETESVTLRRPLAGRMQTGTTLLRTG